jgi:hypothetical protein
MQSYTWLTRLWLKKKTLKLSLAYQNKNPLLAPISALIPPNPNQRSIGAYHTHSHDLQNNNNKKRLMAISEIDLIRIDDNLEYTYTS